MGRLPRLNLQPAANFGDFGDCGDCGEIGGLGEGNFNSVACAVERASLPRAWVNLKAFGIFRTPQCDWRFKSGKDSLFRPRRLSAVARSALVEKQINVPRVQLREELKQPTSGTNSRELIMAEMRIDVQPQVLLVVCLW